MEKETRLEEQVDERMKVGSPGDLKEDHPIDSDVETDDSVESKEEESHENFAELTKAQLIERIKSLTKETDIRVADHMLREIKPYYTQLRDLERELALKKFLAEGGSENDFEYRGDDYDQVFDAAVRWVSDQKISFHRQQEEERAGNLRKREELLEKLRTLLDSSDTTDQFNRFKEILTLWRGVGPIAGPRAKTLWANYHALVDRFYDNQSIYFELKELDRRRNLESKLELCARAERLKDVQKINEAVRELNELHQEFKHIGPIPIEEKDRVWLRFKTASDAAYARRDEYVKGLQQQLAANYDAKAALCGEAESFAVFTSDKIKEWNSTTKSVLELQKKWDIIGSPPRNKAKDINRRFWSAFKTFFSKKSAFFKQLDAGREQNLELKNEMVKKATELKESTDWEKTSNELRNLQQKWREVGPVPERYREKIFKEFKEACDHFFGQKRTLRDKAAGDQVNNLKAKEEVIHEMEQAIESNSCSRESLKSISERFDSLGFVPRKEVERIRAAFHTARENYVQAIADFSADDKTRLLLEMELIGIRKDPMGDRKIIQKEQVVRKKISKVENDIALWRNNLEFFAKSANADSIRGEFNIKITEASAHLKELKQQLRLLRSVS